MRKSPVRFRTGDFFANRMMQIGTRGEGFLYLLGHRNASGERWEEAVGLRYIIVKRKWISLLLCLCGAVAMVLLVNHPIFVGASATSRQLPIYCVQQDYPVCALSFDAAWGNEDTQDLIDILGRYQVRATFFVVAEWVEKYPESVEALHKAGHEIMNHSTTHPHCNGLSPEQLMAEIETCNQKIEAITKVHPTLFRPPYGEYNDQVINTVRSMGMEPIQWDVDSLDWKELPADEITKRVTDKVAPGSIVLFHNAAKHTPEALPMILEQLLAQGYAFLPVSELILHGDYTIDHAGRQCPAE